MKPRFLRCLLGAALALCVRVGAQTAEVMPVAANLKPDGIPPLSRELFDQIHPYTETRTASLIDWNPARREALILTRFAEVAQLHIVETPGGARRQLTFRADRVTGAEYNPVNANELIYAGDTGGDEFYQFYLLDRTTGKSQRLTAGGRSRNSTLIWSKDGKRIAYSSTQRNGRDSDVWVMDPHNPASARIVVEGSNETWDPSDWSPDGGKLLVTLIKSNVEADLYEVDLATGKREKIGPSKPASGFFDGRYTKDGASALVLSTTTEFVSLQRVNLATKAATNLLPALKWDVEQFAQSDDGKYIAYSINEDGSSRLHVMDVSSLKDATIPNLPAGVMGALHWRKGTSEIGFAMSSAKTPGDVYSFTVGSTRLDRWTFSETGGLDASQFVEPELIHWKSFDGLTISGFLYRPPARFSGPRPIIIDIHGGPESQTRPSFSSSRNFYLNELGVAILYPNVRGSSGYGMTYLNADNGMKREDSVKDIGALLDWIATQPGLDKSRVMVTGGSYGGYMTLASMKLYNDRIAAAVETVGISNFRTFLETTEAYRRDLRRAEYGDERDPAMRDFFETISPLAHASKMTKPMFVIAGRRDPRVPWTEGQQMTNALRANKVPSWFLVAEDEGHGFAKKSNQVYLFAATVEFVRQYLLK